MSGQFKFQGERTSDLTAASMPGGQGELPCRIEHAEQDIEVLREGREELEARVKQLEQRIAALEQGKGL